MNYTYIITHIPSNVKYYGVRYKSSALLEDLGTTYFSSSKFLKKLIKEEGVENFKFEIRKIFETKEAAIEWERKFLMKIDAAKSDMWFNLSNSSGINPGGYKLSKVTRDRMSKPKSEEHRQKLQDNLEKNRKIPEWTEERRKKHSEFMKGNDINLGRKGNKKSVEEREKISNRMKGNSLGAGPHKLKQRTCPHCGKTGSGPNMTRYHFDKCPLYNEMRVGEPSIT